MLRISSEASADVTHRRHAVAFRLGHIAPPNRAVLLQPISCVHERQAQPDDSPALRESIAEIASFHRAVRNIFIMEIAAISGELHEQRECLSWLPIDREMERVIDTRLLPAGGSRADTPTSGGCAADDCWRGQVSGNAEYIRRRLHGFCLRLRGHL